jgi:adenine/guanine phosphoribosyltransferase-like PRPP-binding protein
MPSDETRRLLRTFGVAITQFEDVVSSGAPAEEILQAEEEARARLNEIKALIERLSKSRATPDRPT